MTVKANRGRSRVSLRRVSCAVSLLLLCGAAAARQGTGQSGQSGQTGQPSTTQTGTSGTGVQTNQA
ncbi:MAG TPA: hypothetical protein VE713_13705, partial [Pyrinomonadaceae bacterium]|nr:hypothetical protein [Pyrinomonadaceae bacterium]